MTILVRGIASKVSTWWGDGGDKGVGLLRSGGSIIPFSPSPLPAPWIHYMVWHCTTHGQWQHRASPTTENVPKGGGGEEKQELQQNPPPPPPLGDFTVVSRKDHHSAPAQCCIKQGA